jgi:hypothetical protein
MMTKIEFETLIDLTFGSLCKIAQELTVDTVIDWRELLNVSLERVTKNIDAISLYYDGSENSDKPQRPFIAMMRKNLWWCKMSYITERTRGHSNEFGLVNFELDEEKENIVVGNASKRDIDLQLQTLAINPYPTLQRTLDVTKAIQGLSQRHQQIVKLMMAGYTFVEIGKQLRTSGGTIKVYFHKRIRPKLAQALAAYAPKT